jgi:hypothetical protein
MARAPRQSNDEIFIQRLLVLTDNGSSSVNGSKLQQALGWNSNSYNNSKDRLRKNGAIIVGQGGPGGSIKISTPPTGSVSTEPNRTCLNVFISYSHHDKKLNNYRLMPVGSCSLR